MKKINILKENYEFERIIKKYKPFKYRGYIVYFESQKDNKNPYHFGISVSKKLTNAVGRNKIKRQIKSIIDKNLYTPGFNCIIIIRKSYLQTSFIDNEKDLNLIFKKLNIVEGEKYEKK